MPATLPPEIRALETYRPNVVTEIYADDGQLVGSFALQRRILMTWEQVPQSLYNAVTAIEDQHFEDHWGMDFPRIAGAAFRNVLKHHITEGASTITMQLAGKSFPRPQRSNFPPQNSGNSPGPSNRAPLHQAANFHHVCQPGLPGPRQLWLRSRIAILFRQTGHGPEAPASRPARRHDSRPQIFADHQPSARPCSPQSGDPSNDGRRKNHPRRKNSPTENSSRAYTSISAQRSGALISSRISANISKPPTAPKPFTSAACASTPR